MYQVYQLEGNDGVTSNLICPGPKRKVKYYNGYLVNEHVFHTKEYCQGRKTYNNKVCVVCHMDKITASSSSSTSDDHELLGADHEQTPES